MRRREPAGLVMWNDEARLALSERVDGRATAFRVALKGLKHQINDRE